MLATVQLNTYSPFTLRSPQELHVGLECAIKFLRGRWAMRKCVNRSHLYATSLHLEKFAVSGMS